MSVAGGGGDAPRAAESKGAAEWAKNRYFKLNNLS